jgi:protease I
MNNQINGKRVAFIATDGVERSELVQPWESIQKAGGKPELISLESGEIQTMNHDEKADTFKVDRTIGDVSPDEYDALVLPGGVANPDRLRTDSKVVAFVSRFMQDRKPVAAICHGPWVLVEAGVVKDRTLTSWPSLKTDIANAGGNWVDEQVCVDNGLVTSRKPDDLPAFCDKLVEEISEGAHQPA